jgi:hypothetical protein
MKKASLLLAFLTCFATTQPKTCFSQSVASGHWQLIQGDPFPDSVTQIVAGPGSLVYMATSDKGVFKSIDEGENWTQINTGLNGDLDITMLALGPNGDLLARNSAGDILYSKDASTWSNDGIPWHSQFPNASATSFAFDMSGVPYVGTLGAGIYKIDTIGNWNQIVFPALIPGAQVMLFDSQDRLIVHFDSLYRLKSDFSAIDTSWAVSDVSNTPVQLLKTEWGSLFIVADSLYVLTDQLQKISQNSVGVLIADSIGNLYGYYDANDLWDYMEKSTDHGASWNAATIPSTSENIYGGRSLEATSQGFIIDGAGQPALSVSFDTGFVFTSIHELDENLSINEIDVDRFQTIQAFDDLGGIWSSSDQGNTWKLRKPKQNVQGTLMEDGKYYSTETSRGKGIWPPMVSNDGVNYQPLNVPAGIEGQISASPNGTIWLSHGQAHFMRSEDGGVHWNDFAHFTDSGPPIIPGIDSAIARSVVERDPYIWLATAMAIHLTSDEGATWQVDTPQIGSFFGITGGKGYTIFTHTSGEGIHWLNPGEDPDSSWLDEVGTFVQDLEGTILQFEWPAQFYTTPQALIRETKSGEILDTLCNIPDSLVFSLDGAGTPPMAIDSSGNIFAAASGGSNSNYQATKTGLYRFISATASVAQQPTPSGDLDVSVTNNVLTLSSSDEIQSAEMFDVTGRSMLTVPSSHSTTLTASVASIPSGFYFVNAETPEGTIVRKVMIVH